MQVSFNYKTQWHGLSDENILFDDYLVLLRSREIYGDYCDPEDQPEVCFLFAVVVTFSFSLTRQDAVPELSPSLSGLMQGEAFPVARDNAMRTLRQSLHAPHASIDGMQQLMTVQQALASLNQRSISRVGNLVIVCLFMLSIS
jgi:hypothetical protein